MTSPGYWAARVGRGLAKVAAGLGPFSESVWPGAKNDLFVAHLSIYEYFARHVRGKTVLDLGCGTGYGDAALHRGGAKLVTAVDIDERSLRFARRRFGNESIRFIGQDLESMTGPARSRSSSRPTLSSTSTTQAACWRKRPDGWSRPARSFSRCHRFSASTTFPATRPSTTTGTSFRWTGGSRSSSSMAGTAVSSPIAPRRTTRRSIFHHPSGHVVDSSRDDIYERGAITAVFHLRRLG